MPVSLSTCSKYGDVVDMMSDLEDEGSSKRSTKCCKLLC